MFSLKKCNLPWVNTLIAKKHVYFKVILFSQVVLLQLIQFSICIDFIYANIKTFSLNNSV